MNFLIRYLKSIFIDLNIQGQSNEFVYINKGKEFPIRIKNKTFELKINGNNNKVKMVGKQNQKNIKK